MNGVIHRLEICTIVFAMNCGMDYWVSYSFYSPASSQKELKSMKKYRWWVTALMSLEQTAITYNSFGVLQSNKDFQAPLLGQIRWYQGFNCWQLPLPRTRRVKSLRIFFSKYAIIYPMYFNALYWKICITLLCPVFAGPVTIDQVYLLKLRMQLFKMWM